MRKILLLCLLGLSSTSFAITPGNKSTVLAKILSRKTISKDEFQQQLKNAEQQLIHNDVKKIIQDSFNTHQKDLEKLDLPKETVQNILNSLGQDIIEYSIHSPQNVNPLVLLCALMKEAETALNEERFALARFDTLLITFIAKGGLGSQSVQMTEGENIESIDQIATITPLCHTYSILGLIKEKQIKNGNNKKFVDIYPHPLNYEIIDHIIYELNGEKKERCANSKQYIKSLYKELTNIASVKSNYYNIKNKINDSLIIPQLLAICCNEKGEFEKKYKEEHLSYIYGDISEYRLDFTDYIDFPVKKEKFNKLLENEEWLNIAKNPPISIVTKLTKKYMSDIVSKLYTESEDSHNLDIINKIENFIKEHYYIDFSKIPLCEIIVNALEEEEEDKIIDIIKKIINSENVVAINKEDHSLIKALSYDKLKLAKYLIDQGFSSFQKNSSLSLFSHIISKEILEKDNFGTYLFGNDKIEEKYKLLSQSIVTAEMSEEMSEVVYLYLEEFSKNIHYFYVFETIDLLFFKYLYSEYFNALMIKKNKSSLGKLITIGRRVNDALTENGYDASVKEICLGIRKVIEENEIKIKNIFN